MLGDIILTIKKWLKQNIICVHDYNYMYSSYNGEYHAWLECTKCGKIKKI
jgi:Fe2+ or Zn2+ uptake regulation protein